MVDLPRDSADLLPQQRVCPTNDFIEFKEIEQVIPERFEQQVRKYPDHIAVKTDGYELDYKALNQAANRVAWDILSRREIGEGRVALLLENDAPMIAAMLGVLKSGKAYVPLDPSLPRARNTYIIEDSQAQLIATNSRNLSLARDLNQNNLQTINIDELDPELSPENPGVSVSPDAPTWILYTSGSTGQPKGVVQNHRNVLHFIMNYTNSLHICADDRFVLLYSFSANAAAHETFSALLNGASLYPLSVREKGLDRLTDWLIKNEITIYGSVPTLFAHFAGTLTGEENFPRLRLIKTTGEPVYKRHVDLYKKHFSKDCIFVNRLGSTETGSIRWYFFDKETQITENNVPVGYPVRDNEILIIDDDGRQIDPGQVGEIAVRSRYLSPGYWRKPERTKAAFLPDPEGGDKRIYRTGDLGRMLPDGCLIYLGRKDFQVKIRGYRIEVAEIEAALLKHPAIKDAAVWTQEIRPGNQRLVAYIVPAVQQVPTFTELRQYLAEILPEYMLPFAFVMLDALPLAPNGKLNRRVLPQPSILKSESDEGYVPPRDELESTLKMIWEKVLDIQPISITDNFFEIGGHSLLAVRIFDQISREFGKTFPLAALLQAPTIEQLADVVRQKEPPLSSPLLVNIQPGSYKLPLFCVHGCRGEVLFYNHLARYLGPGQPFYALRAQGLDGKKKPHTRIEDMAVDYMKEIRAVQPEGPYLLCGAAYGGWIAYEMAQELTAQGQKVALLVILDTFNLGPASPTVPSSSPNPPVSSVSTAAPSRKSLTHYVRRSIYHLKRGQLIWVLRNILRRHVERVTRVFTPPRERYAKDVQRAITKAVYNYFGQPYSGRIVYFLPDARERVFRSSRTWYELASGRLDVYIVPGRHLGILDEPTVQIVAQKLRACLDQAQADSSDNGLSQAESIHSVTETRCEADPASISKDSGR